MRSIMTEATPPLPLKLQDCVCRSASVDELDVGAGERTGPPTTVNAARPPAKPARRNRLTCRPHCQGDEGGGGVGKS